jgi:hypothetical protein
MRHRAPDSPGGQRCRRSARFVPQPVAPVPTFLSAERIVRAGRRWSRSSSSSVSQKPSVSCAGRRLVNARVRTCNRLPVSGSQLAAAATRVSVLARADHPQVCSCPSSAWRRLSASSSPLRQGVDLGRPGIDGHRQADDLGTNTAKSRSTEPLPLPDQRLCRRLATHRCVTG